MGKTDREETAGGKKMGKTDGEKIVPPPWSAGELRAGCLHGRPVSSTRASSMVAEEPDGGAREAGGSSMAARGKPKGGGRRRGRSPVRRGRRGWGYGCGEGKGMQMDKAGEPRRGCSGKLKGDEKFRKRKLRRKKRKNRRKKKIRMKGHFTLHTARRSCSTKHFSETKSALPAQTHPQICQTHPLSVVVVVGVGGDWRLASSGVGPGRARS
jgi:hypothetical protein